MSEPMSYTDPAGKAARLSALVGALGAVVALVVGAIQSGGWPEVEAVTAAIMALVVAGGGVWADLQARKRAIAPATLVEAAADPTGPTMAPVLTPHLQHLVAEAKEARA